YDEASNYDFRYISGQDSSIKDFLYIYTERPIYRPGDTVFYKGLLRSFNINGYSKSKAKKGKLKVMDGDGKFFKDFDVIIDKNSNFNGNFSLPTNMNLGRYSFEFTVEGKEGLIYNDGQFFVEEYKKPAFKINMEGGQKDLAIGSSIDLKISPEYYFGGKLINTKYLRSILVQDYFFDAKFYSDYQFGEGYKYFECLYWGYCDYSDNVLESGEGKIGVTGEDIWKYAFTGSEEDSGEKIYNFNVTVEDPDTKKQVSKTQSYVLHNTDGYVGIKSPYWNTKENGIKLDGVLLDYDAKPISGKNVTIELHKVEWKNVKKQGLDGVFYNNYEQEKKKEGDFSMTSNDKGEFGDTLITKGEGEYEIKAIYTGINKKSFISVVSTYVSGNSETYYWNEGNNTVTDLVSEKSMLKVGETANFVLKSPVNNGKMFVAIEKDDGILDYFIQDIKSNGEKIFIPVKDTYYPNFYVKVFLIGKDGTNPLPVYKRALSVIKVITDYKKIKVEVIPAKTSYLPGEKMKITIKTADENSKPIANANGSISIVDESLLALKGNPKKNLFAFFYDMKRYLGTSTFISLMNLIEKLEVKDIGDGEKGGAGEGIKGGLAKKKRGIFKDTAYWQANFTTDKNGKYTLTTDALPDNLTTWVIESVVSTPDDNKIGVGEASVTTTKRVIINDNLPRFLSSTDTITIAPVIFNKTGKDSYFDVSIKASNIEINNNSKSILIKKGEQVTVEFKGKVADIGIAENKSEFSSKLTIKAVSKDNQDLDEIEKNIPIKESSTPEFVSTVGKTTGASFDEKIDLTGVPLASTKLKVNYSATLLSNVLDSVDYLKNFPYGCSEQITSAIMSNVYIKKLYNSVNIPFDLKTKMVKKWVDSETGYKQYSVDELIKNYLIEIAKFQKNSGGFSYWTENNSYYISYANFDLTSYIVESIGNIKDLGYNLDDKIMKNAISYLKTRFYTDKIE
ncbi:hypothetical protein KAZ01_03620, partial [Candidatus Gracilibacteria bacterium]|nr:hypothetical protein [Candidatus Gracilibacteria bacterium]